VPWDSGTVTTKQEAGNDGRRPLTERLQGERGERRSMKYRTLGRTRIEGGEVSLDDERLSGS
jgi:hypothetical protein